MTIYPVEFHRRFEQKWAHRAGVLTACASTPRATRASRIQRVTCLDRTAQTGGELVSNQERGNILDRGPWLAIGQGLQAEYSAFEKPVPERLVALLKELEGLPPLNAH